jgi:sugar phosphate isomerase/epimerase
VSPGGPRLASTLFSFSGPYHAHEYSFDQLVETVAALELGPGLEIDGFQCIRGYPHVTDELANHFKCLVERCGLEACCLDGFPDFARRPDRMMGADEQEEFLEAQIAAAQKLGIPLLWLSTYVRPEILERLLPAAERSSVKLGIEIGAPLSLDGPEVAAYRALFDRVASPYLGFIPDFGATVTEIPPGTLVSLQKDGLSSDLIALLVEIWQSEGTIAEKGPRLIEEAHRLGADSAVIARMMPILALFGREQPARWLDLMPYVIHVHAKFFELDSNGNALAVPYAELLSLFRDAGYAGYVSLEWGGQIWADSSMDSFATVRAQHDLCYRLLAG